MLIMIQLNEHFILQTTRDSLRDTPLVLHIAEHGQVNTHIVSIEHNPQVVVPANAWQSAQSNGDWTLVCCIVAPAFEFDTFEMAPPGWDPQSETTLG